VYNVRVFERTKYKGLEVIAELNFPFGEWKEIGYWLDERGFNVYEYEVRIKFIKMED